MSYLVLDISLVQFLERLKNVVPVLNFWIGVIKAPVFGYAGRTAASSHGRVRWKGGIQAQALMPAPSRMFFISQARRLPTAALTL